MPTHHTALPATTMVLAEMVFPFILDPAFLATMAPIPTTHDATTALDTITAPDIAAATITGIETGTESTAESEFLKI